MSNFGGRMAVVALLLGTSIASAADPLILDAHSGAVTAVAYSDDGSLLLTAGMDGLVKLWEPGTGKLKKELKGHKGRVSAAAFLPGGKSILSVGGEETAGEVKLWDVEKGEATSLRELKTLVRNCSVSPDGKWFAWDEDRGVVVWDADKKKAGEPLFGMSPTPKFDDSQIAFSPDGKLLAGVSRFGPVVWALQPKPGKGPRIEKPQDPTGVAFTADGTLVMPSARQVVTFADPATGKFITNIGGFGDKAIGIAASKDGKTIAFGVAGTVRLADTATRKETATLTPPGGKGHAPGKFAFSPDGTRLASGNVTATSGSVYIWEVPSAK